MTKEKEMYMARLSKEASKHPERWVNDLVNSDEINCDDLINWYKPSKYRLNALILDGEKTPIYVTDKVFKSYMRPIWKERKDRENHPTCSLDELYEKHDMEVCEDGQIYSESLNPYSFQISNVEEEIIREEIKNELLAEADMLGPGYKEIVAYLLDDYSWAEIGRIMGLSKQVMHKRKMRLAKKFEYLKK